MKILLCFGSTLIVSVKLHRRCSEMSKINSRDNRSLWSTEKYVKRIRQRCSFCFVTTHPLGFLRCYKVHVTPESERWRTEDIGSEVYRPTQSLLRNAIPLCHIGDSSRDQCSHPVRTFFDVMFKCVYDEFPPAFINDYTYIHIDILIICWLYGF